MRVRTVLQMLRMMTSRVASRSASSPAEGGRANERVSFELVHHIATAIRFSHTFAVVGKPKLLDESTLAGSRGSNNEHLELIASTSELALLLFLISESPVNLWCIARDVSLKVCC